MNYKNKVSQLKQNSILQYQTRSTTCQILFQMKINSQKQQIQIQSPLLKRFKENIRIFLNIDSDRFIQEELSPNGLSMKLSKHKPTSQKQNITFNLIIEHLTIQIILLIQSNTLKMNLFNKIRQTINYFKICHSSLYKVQSIQFN